MLFKSQLQNPKPGGIAEMLMIAFPMLIANACDTILIFTDRIFLSKLDPILMNAAMGGGLSVYMLMSFFVGICGYATAIGAQYFGADQKEKCAVASFQGVIIVLCAFPLLLLIKPLIHHYFSFMGLSEAQIAHQISYFNILIFLCLPALLKICLNTFFSAIGKTAIIMFVAFLTMVLNVVLNYALVFGNWGFPEMGIEGAAYGSIIASWVGCAILFAYFLAKKFREEYQTHLSFRFVPEIMKKLIRFGYPAGLEMFLNVFSFIAMIFVFQSVSDVVATASTIVLNWDLVSYVPLIGIEIGVTSLVGRYMGAKDPDLAHRATVSGIKFGLMYSSIVFSLFLFFPEQLVSVFRPHGDQTLYQEAFPIAVVMQRMACLYVFGQTIIICLIGALRGAGDTIWAMILNVSLHWLLIPVVYILLKVLHLSAIWGWAGLIGVFLVFVFIVAHRYRSGKWRELEIV